MKALTALLRREYLEHRGAFFWAPAALLGVFTLGLALAIVGNRFKLPLEIGAPTALKLYEMGLVGMSQLWWWYLLVVLFFYYADAFSADRRNNAMLFWKSMPVSDLGILANKMIAGLTLLPAIVFGFVLLSGVSLYLLTLLGVLVLPNLSVPAIPETIARLAAICWFALIYFVLGLLWYAPFFAWVGLLSTVFRRWSIPLALLVPMILSLLENALFFGNIPEGGYIYRFLAERLEFGFSREVWFFAVLGDGPVNVDLLQSTLLSGINWLSLAGGLAVAAVFVYVASLYRRRGVAS